MALNLQLNALEVPFGTEFPGDVQSFLQLIEEYVEVVGGADFDGVNYGSTEPSPDDRDKAWFRTDESGTPLGWYAWDGSVWEVLPAKAFVGSVADRDALVDPQEGTLFMVAGTGLDVYTGTEWEHSYPSAAAQQQYDRSYFFTSYQQLVNATGDVASWTQLDLSDYISDAGITAPKAAYIAVECGFSQTGFASGPNNFNVTLRVSQDDTVSELSNTLLKASAQATQDDDRVSSQAQTFGIVPLPADQDEIFYTVDVDGGPPGVFAKVYLVGFIY